MMISASGQSTSVLEDSPSGLDGSGIVVGDGGADAMEVLADRAEKKIMLSLRIRPMRITVTS